MRYIIRFIAFMKKTNFHFFYHLQNLFAENKCCLGLKLKPRYHIPKIILLFFSDHLLKKFFQQVQQVEAFLAVHHGEGIAASARVLIDGSPVSRVRPSAGSSSCDARVPSRAFLWSIPAGSTGHSVHNSKPCCSGTQWRAYASRGNWGTSVLNFML